MKAKPFLICLILACLAMLLVGAVAVVQDLPDEGETQAIAKEAYVYGFPMVMNYKTMFAYAVDAENPEYKGPFNEVSCEARLFTPDNQPVIRMNQDTLYSSTVLDLSRPVQITLPDVGGRYMSMHVVNQDHYCFVDAKPGTYELTEDSVGTRFALVTVRTFADVTDPDDLTEAHAAQDAIKIGGCGDGRVNCIPISPGWNYAIRMYEPRAEILDGSWRFPEPRPVD